MSTPEHRTTGEQPPTPPDSGQGADFALNALRDALFLANLGQRAERDVQPALEQPVPDNRIRREVLIDQAISNTLPPPGAPRPTSPEEIRAVARVDRRRRRAFQRGAEKARNAAVFGADPGVRHPHFQRGTIPDEYTSRHNGNGRSAQESARGDRFRRISDIGTPEQAERLDRVTADGSPLYSRTERKAERIATRRYWAAADSQAMLNGANELDRLGRDTGRLRIGRLRARVSQYWRMRRKAY